MCRDTYTWCVVWPKKTPTLECVMSRTAGQYIQKAQALYQAPLGILEIPVYVLYTHYTYAYIRVIRRPTVCDRAQSMYGGVIKVYLLTL